MTKIYYAPKTISLATIITLEEIGVPYEGIAVDFSKDEQKKSAYLEVNQKARVPTLITSHGVLTETPAMLSYLAHTYPEAELAPLTDAYALAQLHSIMSYICSTVHVAHAHRMRGHRWSDDPSAIAAMQAYVPTSMAQIWRYVEDHIMNGDHDWVMGNAYTVVDPYLFTVAMWMEGDGVDPSAYPKVHAHRNRVLQRAAVIKALKIVPA